MTTHREAAVAGPPTSLRETVRLASSGRAGQRRERIIAEVVSDRAGAVAAQAAAFEAGCGFLPVRVAGGSVHIGPVCVRERGPCAACALDSYCRASAVQDVALDETARFVVTEPWLSWVQDVVGALLDGDGDDAVVYVLSHPAGTVREHRVTRRPGCPECSTRPIGHTEVPQPVPRVGVSPATGADAYRTRPMIALDQLRRSLVDPLYGPITRVFRDAEAPLAFACAEAPLADGRPVASGYGRSPDFEAAQQVAILECLERIAGYMPVEGPAAVASPAELGPDAVPLSSLGLPDPRWNDHPASRLRPYHPDEITAWVWAVDLIADRRILVPQHVAYWGVTDAPGNARFIYESSNGCAIGSCLEEALFHGALEVVERDAFLLHWYARRPPVQLEVQSVRDETSLDYLAIIEDEGFSVRLLDITTALGVPVVWALALDARPGREIASLSAAAAHPILERAVRGALAEVSAMCVLRRRAAPPDRAYLADMLRDPAQVKTLEDHVALYTLPESLDRLRWAIHTPGPPVALAQRPGLWPSSGTPDCYGGDMRDMTEIEVSTRLLLGAMTRHGMRPLAVRLTTSREADLGLETVKVLAPGALPMTFGHVHHRTRGFPRLDQARQATGQVGPVDPHPFP